MYINAFVKILPEKSIVDTQLGWGAHGLPYEKIALKQALFQTIYSILSYYDNDKVSTSIC